MEKLIDNLKKNKKIESVKTEAKESLEDEVQYKRIIAFIDTRKNLYEWAKAIYIMPAEDGLYNIEFYFTEEPEKTLLKDIYQSYKTKDWVKPSYGHDKPFIYLKANEEILNKCINWFYSKLN